MREAGAGAENRRANAKRSLDRLAGWVQKRVHHLDSIEPGNSTRDDSNDNAWGASLVELKTKEKMVDEAARKEEGREEMS